MPTLIKSYDGSQDFNPPLSQPAYQTDAGACFNNPSSCTIDSAKFYLSKRTGSPTGNAVVKIYAITGTVGTDAKPTGGVSIVSNNFDVSTLAGTSAELVTFTFNGETLGAGDWYIGVFYDSGTADVNDIKIYCHSGDGDASINYAETQAGTWTGYSAYDCNFFVYKTAVGPANISKVAGVAKASINEVAGVAIGSAKKVAGVA